MPLPVTFITSNQEVQTREDERWMEGSRVKSRKGYAFVESVNNVNKYEDLMMCNL